MGTIAEEILRLQTAKANIKTSINSKGVNVPSEALISDYPQYINQISGGGGASIDDFTDAYNLFYAGRFLNNFNDFLGAFIGSKCNYCFSATSGANITIGADKVQAVIEKALYNQQSPTTYSGNVNLSNLCNQYCKIEGIKNIDIDITNNVYANTVSVDFGSAFRAFGQTGKRFGDIKLNLINNRIIIRGAFSHLVLDGEFEVHARLYSYDTSFTMFSTAPSAGHLNILHLIPTAQYFTCNLSNVTNENVLDETTLINTIDAYTAEEVQGKTMTFKIPSALYNSLSQSTIAAAAAKNITFTT